MLEVLSVILIVVIFLAVIGVYVIYGALSWGLVSYYFYQWFVYSEIPNLPEFSIAQFIGFMFFIGVIMPKNYFNIKEEYKDTSWKTYTSIILLPWISLLIGYLFSLFL